MNFSNNFVIARIRQLAETKQSLNTISMRLLRFARNDRVVSFPISKLQDIRQTKEYASFMEKIGWKVENLKNTSEVAEWTPRRWRKKGNASLKHGVYVFIKKLPLFPFFVIKVLHYHPPLQLNKLEKLCKKHRPILVKLEPFEIEKTKGSQIYFKVLPSNKSPLIPTKTLWINLSKSEEKILADMKQKTRYNLKKALKTPPKWPNGLLGGGGVKIIPGDKITPNQLLSFYQLWSKNKPFGWLFKPDFNELKWLVESFGKKCFFIFVFQRLSLLTSCLILTSNNMAFYWHNCSTKTGKELFAPTLCIWEAIKESKRQSLKIFDFEGLWDERFPNLNKGWQGFSRFKKGFSFFWQRDK